MSNEHGAAFWCDKYHELNQQLAAEQQAHAATKQQLAAEQEVRKKAEEKCMKFSDQCVEVTNWYIEQKQRAEAAEARIKASREQEPVAYTCAGEVYTNWQEAYDMHSELHYDIFNLYAQPPIPPGVAELQRQLEEARRVPEGWKLVPIQMTTEMRDAGNIYTLNRSTLCRIWDDMLSAAPQPKEQI